MNKKNCIAALLIAISLVIAGIPAVTHAAQVQGDKALNLSGGFFHSQGADVGTLNMEVGFGYFQTENLELGVQQTLGYSFVDDADDQWVASTIPYINYHFRGLSINDTFQPFIGAFIGASYNEDDITGTLGPQVGFKSFVNDRTFIMVKYRYEWFFNDMSISEIDDNTSDGNHVVTVGIGFLF